MVYDEYTKYASRAASAARWAPHPTTPCLRLRLCARA